MFFSIFFQYKFVFELFTHLGKKLQTVSMATRVVYASFLKQKSYEIQKKGRRSDSIYLGDWVGDIGHYVVNT